MEDLMTVEDMVKDWDSYSREIEKNPVYRRITLDAWNRCKEYDLEPSDLKHAFLSEEDFRKKIRYNSCLLEAAAPFMEYLSQSMAGKPHIIALSDWEGWLIALRGMPLKEWDEKAGITLGACFAEKHSGNNGIGTAIALNKPVFVYGQEHFGLPYKTIGCLGVPIRDERGDTIGALGVAMPKEYAHPSAITLAVACVNSIEKSIVVSKQSKIVNQSDKLLAIGTLLSSSVHDMKNTLAVIRGLGQLGYMVTAAPKEKQYFNDIIKHTDVMWETINNYLNNLNNDVALEVHSLNAVLTDAVQYFDPICRASKIELELILDGDIDIEMNVELLKRAIINILSNSVKALEKGGKLSVAKQGNTITIRDTGTGIPPEIRKHMFEPFNSGNKKGSGLGLYSVKYVIVKLHKGKIWYDTEVSKGTTFYIQLPYRIEKGNEQR